ncbi:Clr5 domain-containing protein [Xylaria longipes]|nr:Clr5 domain-containing protein [Xylaria longipes]
MYKTRFKKWGLARKRSRPACVKDTRPARASRPVMSASGPPETERKSIAPKTSTRQITLQGSIHTLQQYLWTQSAIRSMAPPDCYRFAELACHHMQLYISSIGFPDEGSSVTDRRLVTIATGAEWLNCATTAKTLLFYGHFQRAVLLIDVCCQQYKSLLGSQDPSLMVITVAAVLKVLRCWPSLAQTFLSFVCKMSQVVLGTSHPLSVLFHRFKEAGLDHLAYCIGVTLQCFLGGIVHIMPHPMMESYGDTYYDLVHGRILDQSTTTSEILHLQHRLQRRLQGQPETQSNFSNSLEDNLIIRCRMAWLYFYGRRYEEATELILEMLSEPTVDAYITTGCYDILYDIAVAENNYDLALDMMQKAVETSVEAYGYAHYTTTRKMVRLEFCLRGMGRLSEADKVQSSWEMQLAQICEKVQRLRL